MEEYKMKFSTKFRKFIRYIRSNYDLKAYFYLIEDINSNTITCHLVPYDFGIEEIPLFKKCCEKAGFNCTNIFISDIHRNFGYQDYHDCTITDNNLIKDVAGDFYEEN